MTERVIEVLDANGRLKPIARGVVLARMFHPEDEDKADLLATVWFQMQCHDQGVVPPGEITKVTLEGGGLPIALKQADKASGPGTIVGGVLEYYARLALHRPKDASKNKAMWLARTGLTETGRGWYWTRNGERLPNSRQTVIAAWRSHGSVAHLWAAFCDMHEPGPTIEVERMINTETFPDFLGPDFLGKARAFFDIGRPILSSQHWAVPNSPDIPEIALTLPKLNADEMALLADYRHHKD